jgi:hypothetical protein
MDPGDQLYTLDELRCWKVENLGVLDDETERSNEIGNEGGASVLCFSACKLNLPLENIHRPCQPYSLSACHLSMLHHHGLTRTCD